MTSQKRIKCTQYHLWNVTRVQQELFTIQTENEINQSRQWQITINSRRWAPKEKLEKGTAPVDFGRGKWEYFCTVHDDEVKVKPGENEVLYRRKQAVFSLCLTKHPAMKTYWIGGIAPSILGLGTKRRWVVSLTPRPLYPQSRSGRGGEEKNFQPSLGIEP